MTQVRLDNDIVSIQHTGSNNQNIVTTVTTVPAGEKWKVTITLNSESPTGGGGGRCDLLVNDVVALRTGIVFRDTSASTSSSYETSILYDYYLVGGDTIKITKQQSSVSGDIPACTISGIKL